MVGQSPPDVRTSANAASGPRRCLENANTAAPSLTPPRPYGVKFIRCASLRSTHPTRPRLRRHAAAERYRHAQCALLPGSSRQAVACGLNGGLRGQCSGTIPQCLNLERQLNHTASKPCILGFEPLKDSLSTPTLLIKPRGFRIPPWQTKPFEGRSI